MLKQKFFNRTAYRTAFLLFLLAVIISSSLYIIAIKTDSTKSRIKLSEKFHLNALSHSFEKKLSDVIPNLYMLGNDFELQNYLNNKNIHNYNVLSKEFLEFSQDEQKYNKVRFIDTTGKEIIRINFNNGKSSIAKKNELQNQKNQYYFKKTIKLNKDQIFISHFDLNVKHGKIERPFKPILRFCIPIFNRKGVKEGIIVLNYLGAKFLETGIKEKHPDMLGSVMLLNKNGYFLESENGNQNKFGFIFKDKQGINFAKFYPTAWETIKQKGEGTFITDEGMFTCTTISPRSLKKNTIPANLTKIEKPIWIVVSHISHNKLVRQYSGFKRFIILTDLLFFVFISIALFIFLKFDKQRKIQQKKLEESEEKFRTVFSTSPDSVTISKLSDGVFVNINNAFTEIFGYSDAEIIGNSSLGNNIWVNPEDREKLVNQLQQQGEVTGFETELRKKNNEIVISLISAKIINILDESYLLAITRDITERKKAERELSLREQELSLIYDSVGNIIYYLQVEAEKRYTFLSVNKTFLTTTGLTEKQIIGKTIDQVIPEPSLQLVYANYAKAIKEKKIVYWEETSQYPTGTKTGIVSIAPVYAADGNCTHLIGSVHDITERKKAELEILKLSQVVEQSKASIIVTDLEGNMEYVNPYFTELTGYTQEEAIGQNPRILKSGEQTKEFYIKMWDKISGGKVWNGEFHNKKKNGELYWEEAVISPIISGTGTILNYFGIKTDVTERKKNELELKNYRDNLELLVDKRTADLRKSEEIFRALAENSKDSIIRFDSNYKPIYMNPVLEKQIGINAEKILGTHPNELGFSNGLIQLWKNAVKKVFNDKATNRIEFRLANGTWIDWLLVPEYDKDKNVTAVIGSGRDITILKELEQKLEIALSKEKEINKLKTQFITTVSHEFRTPLTSIFSSIDLLEMFGNKWTEGKKKEQYSQMRGSINRLTGMLDDVLKISRMERGKLSLNIENINFNDFIKSILTEIKLLLTPKHKLLQNINIAQKNYYLDKEITRTVLLNLLSNAIKYSTEGGIVELNVREEKNNLLFIISDQGEGIAEEDLKHIFSEFYRAKETAYIQGTGLGLSIAKSLVDKLNGKISVESKLGKGTKFTVTIPIKHP